MHFLIAAMAPLTILEMETIIVAPVLAMVMGAVWEVATEMGIVEGTNA